MKREKSAGGLFGLLARQYLLFTLALLTIAAAVLALWVLYTARLYRVPDWDSLLADPALAEGKWDTLRRHLTPGSGFAVYHEKGALVFAAGEGFDPALTEGELACVPAWNEGVQIDAYELSGDGAARHLVVAHTPDGEGGEATRTAVLDENYRVLLGGLEEGRTAYTPREYRYLTGTRFENGFLARAEVTGPQGGRYVLLLRETYPTDAQYRQVLGGQRVGGGAVPSAVSGHGGAVHLAAAAAHRPAPGGAERRGGGPEPGRGPAGGRLRRPKGDTPHRREL